ncbi:MAG: arylesterase [Nitrospinae bacterium CG11_big_fil_rev_8_21_14_0_20_56_8]|nr:MAG: arylesterase [Nitrospinae bacterium CG11_big_fil_rev_8_21_14_0_20_56_8]
MWLRRIIATAWVTMSLVLACPDAGQAAAGPVTLVVVGDSLSAGYGLAEQDAFPPKLERALRAKGHDVRVVNAGVSGDTTAGGRARLAWTLGDDVDAVILELGANDALRGLDTNQAFENLSAMLKALQSKGVPALLAGMKAPPNMGDEYVQAFDAIYPRLAGIYDVTFYPFFLAGIVGRPALNQADGMHPTPEGVDIIVANILPAVEKLLTRIRKS